MEAYKFDTTILENGVIKIPQFEKFANRKVEVSVVFKSQKIENKEKTSVDEFLEEWTGFAKGIEPDTEKYNYLMKKHT